MKKYLKHVLGSAAVGLVVAATALPAQAATTASTLDTSMCSTPLLSQPFHSYGDNNWYTLAPGQTTDNFAGTGWTLSGGAKIVATALADGTKGEALELTDGAEAVSPVMCVQSNYPTARMQVDDVVGPPSVQFKVSYETTSGWGAPKITGAPGTPGGWSVSPPLRLSPAVTSGWQPVQFVLVGTGKSDEALVSNLWVDPHMTS